MRKEGSCPKLLKLLLQTFEKNTWHLCLCSLITLDCIIKVPGKILIIFRFRMIGFTAKDIFSQVFYCRTYCSVAKGPCTRESIRDLCDTFAVLIRGQEDVQMCNK
ncbi:uncharacterized protein LOC131678028 [Topomyia yanbarensis]|uniref:uncharacterized protein LOC131678028 n=1 Tax=Topomyia yanbarensis TaxID=2498891 RepID=UPI00273C1785|nr:uncharacterized protein LOC131678028 [Topomyia yanbarensis]